MGSRCGNELPRSCRTLLSLGKVKDCATNTVTSVTCKRGIPTMSKGMLHIVSEVARDARSVDQRSIHEGVRRRISRVVPSSYPKSFGRTLVRLKTIVYIPGNRTGYTRYPVTFAYLTRERSGTSVVPMGSPGGTEARSGEAIFVVRSKRYATVEGEPRGKLLTNLCRLPGARKRLGDRSTLLCMGRLKLSPLCVRRLPPTGRVFSRVR